MPPLTSFLSRCPRPERARDRYRCHAAGYDRSAQRTMLLRARAIARLALRPGETVLDVACGTGLSFDLLREGVGKSGRIVGVELSPEMLALARQRVARAGWRNVVLIEAAMESAQLPCKVDAVLLNYAHDVLRSPAALQRVFAAACPGTRISVAGIKLMSGWKWPANLYVIAKALPYVTTLEGLARPWSLLESYLESFTWEPTQFGMGYIGCGRVPRTTHGSEDAKKKNSAAVSAGMG